MPLSLKKHISFGNVRYSMDGNFPQPLTYRKSDMSPPDRHVALLFPCFIRQFAVTLKLRYLSFLLSAFNES